MNAYFFVAVYLRYKSAHDPNVVIMDHIGTVSEETTAWIHTVATAPEFVPTK